MNCEFCGEEVEQGALACPGCGSPLERTASAVEPEVPPPEVAAADVSALADQTVWPGTEAEVTPEHVVLEDRLTGGYKGPEPPSSSGAGEQTAEDPFGLRITEKALPAAMPPGDESRVGQRNIIVMMLIVVAVVAAIAAAVYFGFLQKKGGPSLDTPQGVVQEFCRLAAEGDYTGAQALAVPGEPFVSSIEGVMTPYSHQGKVTLKEFDSKTLKASDSAATVEITKFFVEVKGKDDTTEFDILLHTRPFPLPKQVNLVKQGDQWLISS
ncbi:MAG: zinc ribbon domain-containing protein [Actinobacteria bacterium]|nr:zinc ribbon domain-containing protein [Actinomycetota bacterium]